MEFRRPWRVPDELVALQRPGACTDALRNAMVQLLEIVEARKRFAGTLSGLDLHYVLGEGHPLLGRRMPDFDLIMAAGEVRVVGLLHRGRPVLIDFGESVGIDIRPGPSGFS
jgi:3-(3-hydroxy-phenyl)propionate hydroxylase